MSGTPSELATSEAPMFEGLSVLTEAEAEMATFPPYPPYATEPAPPTLAEAVIAGHGLRLLHKSKPRKSLRSLPKPAKPRSPKATDVKMSLPAMRAHARCLRRHGAILTDRLERMSKPRRRTIIYFWRDKAHYLPPDTVARLRSMLNADEPFKPDQAYEYFVNLKKTKKKAAETAGVRAIKEDILSMCEAKKFKWARNATVAFARGIQQRLSRPGRYALADGMLRLSDIILHDMCCYVNMKTPSRRCKNPKAKFMMEMSDKIAVWIDEILTESEDRMLMMDFDEDDDVLLAARGSFYGDGDSGGDGDDSPDNTMGVGGPRRAPRGKSPAHLKFEGNMRKAFEILTDSMEAKGEENLLTVGKFDQTHHGASDELEKAKGLETDHDDPNLSQTIHSALERIITQITPKELRKDMDETVEACSKYLSQKAVDDSGLDGQQLAALDAAGFNAESKAAAETRRLAAMVGGPGGKVDDGDGSAGAAGAVGIGPASAGAAGAIGVGPASAGAVRAVGAGPASAGAAGAVGVGPASAGAAEAVGIGTASAGAAGAVGIGTASADAAGAVGVGTASADAAGTVGVGPASADAAGAEGVGPASADAAGEVSVGTASADAAGTVGVGPASADAAGAEGVGPASADAAGTASTDAAGEVGVGPASAGAAGTVGVGPVRGGAAGAVGVGTASAGAAEAVGIGTARGGAAAAVGVGTTSAGAAEAVGVNTASADAARAVGVGHASAGAAEAVGIGTARGGAAGAVGVGTASAGAAEAVDIGTARNGAAAAVGVGTASAGTAGAVGVGTAGAGAAGAVGVGTTSTFGETEEQRHRRLAEAEEYTKHEEEEKKRLAQQERLEREKGKYKGGALGTDYDPEHLAALDILHEELKAHGSEVFYQQPLTTLTHEQASDWLADPDPVKVEKSVNDSIDTARLHKKFEKKLGGVVKDTPSLKDNMQDVVIEAARKTAECFVAANYNSIVKDNLVSEMQKRGNEILTEVDGAAETYFFAAQRVKRKDPTGVKEPCYQVANEVGKKLDDMIRSRPMPRKLSMTMKEHVKDTSKFLSAVVTKPDDFIEAYVALLAEMEAAGDVKLIEGEVPKSYKESANYLRQLTTFKDTIGLRNKAMQDEIQGKLKNLMAHAPPTGSKGTGSVMDSAIAESAGLLTSYVMLQAEKAGVLDILVKEMQDAGGLALLRHGRILKSFKEGAELLHGKTTDELAVPNADPVVARKIQIKLSNLMKDENPAQFQPLMTEVIEDATTYLAVQLLEPRVLKVCKCYKNVFVQCELWCDDILRRVARPCCTCSRHVSVQALQDLAPAAFLRVTPEQSRVLAPGVEIAFKPCPYQAKTPKGATNSPCPAHRPVTSYLLYETTHKRFGSDSMQPSPSPSTSDSESHSSVSSLSTISPLRTTKQFSPLKSLLLEMNVDTAKSVRKQQEQLQSFKTENLNRILEEMQPPSTSSYDSGSSTSQSEPATCDRCQEFSLPISETSKMSKAKSGYSSRTPIISAEHMVDWDATMVSLLWNVLAWRDWIQETIDHALAYQHTPSFATARGETATSWLSYYRRVTTEALQWRQYSVFSRQLTTRLHLRYRNQEIVSFIRPNVQTKTYIECQQAMLGIIDMFNRWTEWLNLVVKETDSLQQMPGSEIPLYQMRWNHLKTKVKGYSKDWANYNKHLKVSWEQKYISVIADYLPSWKKPGPVWVASTCGAVPSGAVAAGLYDSEVIWVARTMHRCTVVPATVMPSKHYCLVYAEGQVYRYNKYQVMCNAEVRWVSWRSGSVSERAVCVAPGMHVGRVHYHGDHLLGAVHKPLYRCHVVIFGRPFAFNYYELLMLAADDDH